MYDWGSGEDKPGVMKKPAQKYNPVLYLKVIKSRQNGKEIKYKLDCSLDWSQWDNNKVIKDV